jgi:hypothetical protein
MVFVVSGSSTLEPKHSEEESFIYFVQGRKFVFLFSNTCYLVDSDGAFEIVTGGRHHDGTRYVAQLCTWNRSDLALEDVATWYWTGDTEINSVKIGDVDNDGSAEIITGGYFNDGVRDVAQLVVWDGLSLYPDNISTWYWTSDTEITSVIAANVDDDPQLKLLLEDTTMTTAVM